MSHTEGEQTLAETRVLANSVTPYLRVHLLLTGTTLAAHWRATLLGVLPLRRRRLVVPLDPGPALRIRAAVFPDRLAAAVALVTLLYFAPLPIWATALAGTGALLFLLLGLVDALQVRHPAGSALIPICWWQRRRVEAFIAALPGGGTG